MGTIVLHPFMGVNGEYSVTLAGNLPNWYSIDVIATDEFDAVRQAIKETQWNHFGLITVDTLETIEKNLEPVLQFEYEPQ